MKDISYILVITSNYLFEIQEEMELNSKESTLLQDQIMKVSKALEKENDIETLERMIEENKVLIKSSKELIERQKSLIDKYRFWYEFLCKINNLASDSYGKSLEDIVKELESILRFYEDQEEYEKCIFIKDKIDELKASSIV